MPDFLSWPFARGVRQFHHQKDQMALISDGKLVPYIFHMHWTQVKADKVRASHARVRASR